MLKNSLSCEFDYEAFCDEIFASDFEAFCDEFFASNPSSPPLLAAFPDAIECRRHSASSVNNNHEQGPHDILMNHTNFQYKDVVGPDVVGSSPLLHVHASNNQREYDPVIEISSSGEDDDGKAEKHYRVQSIKKPAAAATDITDDLEGSKRKRASNRKASKRAREKKQAQLVRLQSRKTELELNRPSLSNKLADITQKFKGAAEENIALKDTVDKLRKLINLVEQACKKVILESSDPRFQFHTGISGISGSPPPYSQKIGTLQTSLPGVLVEDCGLQHHQTSRSDLEIHQLADNESANQHITTTSTEFQSLFLPPPDGTM